MTDKAGKSVSTKSPSDPTQLLPDGAQLDASADAVRARRLREVADMLFYLPDESEEDMMAKIARAIELYEDLKPADGLEGMLAIQMVGTHHAALECFRMAAVPNQTLASRDMNLKHATKLMALYAQQVAAGGQAIVGNVEAGSHVPSSHSKTTPIAHQAEVPLDVSAEKVPNRRRKPKAE